MTVLRIFLATLIAATTLAAATPAAAQFYMKQRDFSGPPVRGDEPGVGVDMPGANEAEVRAELVWNLRAALNIAALQCDFEPTLLTVPTYNTLMRDHKDEIATSYDTLTKYFKRMNKLPKAAQTALDQFGTRIYSSYSTAIAQFGFCSTASSVMRDALFTPRGQFHAVASNRLQSLRNALVPYGEQRFPRGSGYDRSVYVPRLDPICWKNGEWVEKKCGTDIQWQRHYY